ncbi:MAG: sigma-54-dependent Fis family transcriptional regulator [Deltaproteobacteria bacterium]|nr:sigma-54-dependent Fis family transcriptional regulator [Deltaproteobacteria bacterium]
MDKILIVDDFKKFRTHIKRILEKQGYEMILADCKRTACEKIKNDSPDILLLDLRIPNTPTEKPEPLYGMDVLKTSLASDPHRPVIMISGEPNAKDVLDAVNKFGAYDFLDKSSDLMKERGESYERLLIVLKHALEKRQKALDSLLKIIGRSKKMQEVHDLISKYAKSDKPLLILGETGTGKELVAQAIHALSSRSRKSWCLANCSTLHNENLIESELFGYVKGSFTGAISDHAGRFEDAHNGTIFLDEIGELPIRLQPTLLRAIQEGEIQRVGSNKVKKVDVRVVAATSRDVRNRKIFREDLYYRFVLTIEVPPLCDRKEDIADLVKYFLPKECEKQRCPEKEFSRTAMDRLIDFNWPGNVRQLESFIEKAVILNDTKRTIEEDLVKKELLFDKNIINEHSLQKAMERSEKEFILKALVRNEYNISQTAKELGINRTTLHRKIDKYNITC